MGIRERINENPKPFIIGTSVIVVIGAVLVFWSMRGESDGVPKPSGKAFFSEDDGKTWFPAPYEKLGDPEFKGPGGNEAVLAHIYQHPGEGEFAAYLETYTPEGKQKLSQYYSDAAKKGTPPPDVGFELERLLKKPGSETWVRYSEAGQVMALDAKNGVPPTRVMPKK